MWLRRYFCLSIVSPGRIETGRPTKQLANKTLVSFRLIQRLKGLSHSTLQSQNTGIVSFPNAVLAFRNRSKQDQSRTRWRKRPNPSSAGPQEEQQNQTFRVSPRTRTRLTCVRSLVRLQVGTLRVNLAAAWKKERGAVSRGGRVRPRHRQRSRDPQRRAEGRSSLVCLNM